jgi:hypothetical protein
MMSKLAVGANLVFTLCALVALLLAPARPVAPPAQKLVPAASVAKAASATLEHESSTHTIRLERKSKQGRVYRLDSLHPNQAAALHRAQYLHAFGYQTRLVSPDGRVVLWPSETPSVSATDATVQGRMASPISR